MAIFTAFYSKKKTLNDDSFTWILAWICLWVKPILFDHLPPFTTVFYHQQPKKLWKWSFLWHFTARNDTEWRLLYMIFGMSMCQGQTITVSSLDNYNSCFRTSTAWKTVKIAIFTAFYGKKIILDDYGFTWFLTWIYFRVKPFLFERLPPFTAVFNINNLKNCENGHIYGILRQKMTLNSKSFTRFLAWACLTGKPSLFHCWITMTAVLEHQQPEKLWK